MPRLAFAALISAVAGGIGAWAILTNAYPDEGPWVTLPGGHHGIHVGDVVIVGVWAALSFGLMQWARSRRPTP